MKNKIKYFIILIFFIWIFSYGCFCFVLGELNAFNWDQDVRFGYVFLGVSFSVLSFPISMMIKATLDFDK